MQKDVIQNDPLGGGEENRTVYVSVTVSVGAQPTEESEV